MDMEELKARCKEVWKDFMQKVIDYQDIFGNRDQATEDAWHDLFAAEETISRITGSMISDLDFDRWESELRGRI